jgi:hypothetical protein
MGLETVSIAQRATALEKAINAIRNDYAYHTALLFDSISCRVQYAVRC